MANNFAEALFGARDNARDRVRQQEMDAQANQMRQFQMQEAQTKSRGSQQEALYGLAKGYKDYLNQNPQGGQQYYERFLAPSLRGLGLGDPGPYNEPEAISLADQVLSAYMPQATQTALAPRVVGDALVDSTGKVLYQSPQEAPKPIWDSTRGVFIQQPGAMGQQVTQQDMEGDIALANELIASGVPEAQVDAFLKSRGQRQQPQQGPMAIPVAGVGPKVDEGPQETFSQPQPVTYPDGSVRLVQFGNRGSRREVEGVAPPPTDRDAKPPTEGERKAATLLQRLNFSLGQLQQAVQESPDAASPSLAAEAARRIPFVGDAAANTITPAERQRVEAAQLDILDAALTLGTGAAYTREQLEGYRRSYFPQIGDSQATIDDKADRLNNVIEAARIAAGRAAPEAGAPAAPGGWKIERVD
jgi:hypothetical protein